MKKIFIPFLIVFVVLFASNIDAQINRRNTKKTVGYNASYQRMASGNLALQTFEIREGTLWASGRNEYGQLGDGTKIGRKVFIQIGTDNKWVSIVASGRHTLGIKSDGTLWGWGKNDYGQLGDGTMIDTSSPKQIGTDHNWISVTASNSHSLGLKTDGTMWTWGLPGDGMNPQENSPVQIGSGSTWVNISTGSYHSIGLKSDGTLWAYGDNSFSQLGDGTNNNQINFVQIGTDTKWVSAVSGNYHNLGVKSDGTLWAWGRNEYGQIGDGSIINRNSPVQIGTDNKWVSVSAGANHSLGLKSDGTIWAWGMNFSGQLGDGTGTHQSSPIQIGTDNNWVSIVAGSGHSLAAKSDGSFWGWGQNNDGQCATGYGNDVPNPVLMGNADKWLSLSAGFVHTLGLKSNGTIWGWGNNTNYQLGNGTTVNQSSSAQIGTDNNWVSVAASATGMHTLALKSDGTLWGWGLNSKGQLGDGTNTDKNSPIKIGTDTKWVSIVAGYLHSIGLKSDGTIWSWGYNQHGQLGDGTTTDQNNPVQIGVDANWTSIAIGQDHSLALKSDGTIWAWGFNNAGQLGDGSTIEKHSPSQIGTSSDWVSIEAGAAHSLGLKSDGSFWAWGENQHGELGDGSSTNRSSPYQIGTEKDWIAASAGTFHTLGLKSDGSIWAWGYNRSGQLGDGDSINRNSPFKIGAENDWISIEAGGEQSFVLKTGRSQFCAVGFNTSGQLGDNTTVGKLSFTCMCTSPAAPVASGKTICSGNPALLLADGIGLRSWYIDSIGGTSISIGNTFITDPLTTDTTFYVQDSTCAASTRTAVVVTVNLIALPTVSATAAFTTVCSGTSDTLTGGGAISYVWTGGVTDGVGFAPTITATYTVTGTDGNNCSNTATVTINVKQLPTISVNSETVCAGTGATLTASGADTYFWNTGSTDTSITVWPASSIPFSVKGTANGCTDSVTTMVDVNTLPNVIANASATTICSGSADTLTGSGAFSYTWTGGITDGIGFVPSATTTYTLTGTDGNNCTNLDTITIRVNSLPAIIANASDATMCSGTAIVLTASGGVSYIWTGGITNGISFVPSANATYTVTGIDTNNCSNTATLNIFVNPSPVVTLNSTNESVAGSCDAYIEAVINGVPPFTYHWNDNNSIISPSRNAMCSGNYGLTVIDSTGCSDSADVFIGSNTPVSATVNPLRISVVSTDTSNFDLCNGSAEIRVKGGIPPYIIHFGGVAFNDSVYVINNLCAGFYTANVTDAQPDSASFTFVVASAATIHNSIDSTYADSTYAGILVSSAIQNCTIDYDAIDSILITEHRFIGNDSISITWTIYQDTIAYTQEVIYGYTEPGVYSFVLDLYCTNRISGSTKGIGDLYINGGVTDIEKYVINTLSIYPNPNSGIFIIQSADEGSYSIINELGQVIRDFKLTAGNNYTLTMENLNNGIYFIVGLSNNEMTFQKVIVIK